MKDKTFSLRHESVIMNIIDMKKRVAHNILNTCTVIERISFCVF